MQGCLSPFCFSSFVLAETILLLTKVCIFFTLICKSRCYELKILILATIQNKD